MGGLLIEVLVVGLLLVGTLFIVVAGIGLVRMPDVFLRMSATTKASTLGIVCVIAASVLYFGDAAIALRGLAIALFLTLTTPIAAHMVGRAASADPAVCVWEGTVVDERERR